MKIINTKRVILTVLFIINTILVITNQIKIIDDFIYNLVISIRNPFFDTFFVTITKLGNIKTVIITLLVLIIILPKKEKIQLLTGTTINIGINNIIKLILRRPRPMHLRLVKQGGYSYPSGHTMISVAIYGFLIYIVNRKVVNKQLKYLLILLLLIIIASIGISRIYVGVHYPSDIIGGYLLAIIIHDIANDIFENYIGGFKNDKNDSN